MSPVPPFRSLVVGVCGRAVFARCVAAAVLVCAAGAVLWPVPWGGNGAGWVAHTVLGMMVFTAWFVCVLLLVAARARDAGWSPFHAVAWTMVAGVLALRSEGVWGGAVWAMAWGIALAILVAGCVVPSRSRR